jgi:hypothetical protein
MDTVRPIFGLLILPIAWIATAAGRRINRAICPGLSGDSIAGCERSAFGLATGFVVVALGMLALGLTGMLAPYPVAAWFAVVAVAGWREHSDLMRDALSGLRIRGGPVYLQTGCMGIALAVIGSCFVPPTSMEWDSLSYHLADPKLYVAAHRIYYIPWESHSNFAFNMEMLYSVGMLARSIALAKLFNFVLSVAGAVAVYRVAIWIMNPTVAAWSLFIYVTLPLVFWEAGTAYVDLAATSFATLALLALVLMVRTGDPRFTLVAGVLLGGMLGIKATALVTIVFYAIGIIAHARAARAAMAPAVRSAAVMGLIAVLIGSPWFIKSAVNTGNPFYPFAYSIFGGRYWSEANAVPYAAAQYSFGEGHAPKDLLLLPWQLTMFLLPDHRFSPANTHPFNDTPTELVSLTPLFLICAIIALITPLEPTRGIRLLAIYAVASIVVWFYLTQQVRYLLPIAPALCLLAAWTLHRISSRSAVGGAAAIVALSIGLGFNAVLLARYSTSMWMVALRPSGQQEFVASGLESYGAMQFLNSATPLTAKVICYGEPRTFYLDRDHMWGDLGSQPLYPPYEQLATPAALRGWLLARGYDYVLINQGGTHLTDTTGWAGMVYALTLGSGNAPVFEDRGTVVYAL